ncbi:ubiquitin-related domain-containing protein, partial [Catenaria anguillulae PL171]
MPPQDQQLNYLFYQLDLSAVCRRFHSIRSRSLCSHAVNRIEVEYRKLLVLKFVHGDLAICSAQARRLLNSADCYKSRFGVDPPTDVWGKNEEASSESEDEDEETTAVDQDSESPQHAVDVVHRAGGEPFLIVFVQIETGKIIEVRLTQDVSVGYLKGTIQDLEGLPADQQRLIFTGKQLEDGRYLMSDYGVRTRNVLYLVMRLRG